MDFIKGQEQSDLPGLCSRGGKMIFYIGPAFRSDLYGNPVNCLGATIGMMLLTVALLLSCVILAGGSP